MDLGNCCNFFGRPLRLVGDEAGFEELESVGACEDEVEECKAGEGGEDEDDDEIIDGCGDVEIEMIEEDVLLSRPAT